MSGQRYELQVQSSDRIEEVKDRIQNLVNIPVEHQGLVYGGKLVQDGSTLLKYSIAEGATLHLVPRLRESHGPQRTPPEAFDENNAESTFESWRKIAIDDDFDDDLHIVDPHAHYTRLRSLEQKVVKASEWFRCQGNYDIRDDRLSETTLHTKPASMPEGMWSNIQSPPPFVTEVPTDEFKASSPTLQQTLRSLRKSYLIICRVLDNFRHLSEASFCTSYYSFLVKHTENNVAEVVRISANFIDSIKTGIENATVHINGLGADQIDLYLQWFLEQSLSEVLALRFPREPLPQSRISILQLCRMTVILLDLALVSYLGSHGLRFDLDFIKTDTPSILVNSGEETRLSLECSLQQLACLDEFLDRRKMWVFQFYAGQHPAHAAGSKKAGRLMSILARMEDFADLWGPIWSIPVGEDHPNQIKQYNTSKGVICRVSAKPADADRGIVKCHWYSWSSFRSRQESTLLSDEQGYFMEEDDLLLIGMRFQEKTFCSYGIGDFERSYGNEMGILGTSNSSWRLESIAVGLSFSKLVGIQVQGTQKQIPETTLKQHVLDKWVNKPERANPGILNQFHGVMISHCTGNAVRITLKELLLSEAVRPILNRQIPHWETTEWGSPFLRALRSTSPDDVLQVWKNHHLERREMAQLVCSALEILDATGMGNDGFTAAFLHNDQERSFGVDLQRNEWVNVLRDSPLTAVYAFVNESCVECFTPDHHTAKCDDSQALTVLRTQMAFPEKVNQNRVKLQLQGQNFRVDEALGEQLVISPASAARSLFSLSVPAREIRDPLAQGGQRYQVYVQASSKGFNGMASPRKRAMFARPRELSNRLPDLAPGASTDLSLRSSSPGGFDNSFRDLNHRRLATGSEPSLRGVSHRTISRETDQDVPTFSNTTTRFPNTIFHARFDSETPRHTLPFRRARDVSDASVSLSVPPEATHRTSRRLDPQEYQIRDDSGRSPGAINFPAASLGPSTNSQAYSPHHLTVAPSRTVSDIENYFLGPKYPNISDNIGNYILDNPDSVEVEEQNTNQELQAQLSSNFEARVTQPLGVIEEPIHPLRRREHFRDRS